MKYYLQPSLHAPPPPLEITESEFVALKRASCVLSAAFSLEKNYDLLIGNFLELETSALTIAATSTARKLFEYQEMFELSAEMNRRAVNLLTAARLFVDQLPGKFATCGGKRDDVKTLLNIQYDRNFEFRFMEALRNHVQHSGSAVHSLGVRAQWEPERPKERKEVELEIFVQRRFLAVDGQFKKSVLMECPEEIDLPAAARKYMECLGSVQETIRFAVLSDIIAARKVFDHAITKYNVFSNKASIALAAYNQAAEYSTPPIAIFTEWDDVRAKLARRNCSLKNLSKSVVTTSSSSRTS